tara:strand:- start:528 stop:1136 length:609 start_codon:yes stop_codon:yes gene_type:complete
MSVFKVRASYKPTALVSDFVGEKGNLFYSEQDGVLRISNGITPGGFPVAGSGNFHGNYDDLYNKPTIITDICELTDTTNLFFDRSYNSLNDTPTNIKTVQLFQDGNLQIVTGTVRWYAPGASTIDKITARLSIAADNIITLLIKKNGSIVKTITIPASDSKVILDDTQIEMSVDDYLTVDVTTIGNTNKGSGLSVEFLFTLR